MTIAYDYIANTWNIPLFTVWLAYPLVNRGISHYFSSCLSLFPSIHTLSPSLFPYFHPLILSNFPSIFLIFSSIFPLFFSIFLHFQSSIFPLISGGTSLLYCSVCTGFWWLHWVSPVRVFNVHFSCKSVHTPFWWKSHESGSKMTKKVEIRPKSWIHDLKSVTNRRSYSSISGLYPYF